MEKIIDDTAQDVDELQQQVASKSEQLTDLESRLALQQVTCMLRLTRHLLLQLIFVLSSLPSHSCSAVTGT